MDIIKEPDFIKEVNELLDENPTLLDDITEPSTEQELFESIFRESKYFDADVVIENQEDIQTDYEYVIDVYFKKDFNGLASPITLDGVEVKDGKDAIDYADKLLNQAFGEDKENFKLKAKALFLIYASGLDTNNSNLFGVYACLVSAIRRVGEECDVLADNIARKLAIQAKDNDVLIQATGSLSKCSFLGKPLTTDANDKFASANDNNYITRVNANIRDDSKVNNRAHHVKSKMLNKFYKIAYTSAEDHCKERMEAEIKKNEKKADTDPTKVSKSSIEEKWGESKIKSIAMRKAEEAYKEWISSGELDKVIADMEKDIENEKSFDPTGLIDFD